MNFLTLGLLALIGALCFFNASATPLDDYVNKLDDNYKWEVIVSFSRFFFVRYKKIYNFFLFLINLYLFFFIKG